MADGDTSTLDEAINEATSSSEFEETIANLTDTSNPVSNETVDELFANITNVNNDTWNELLDNGTTTIEDSEV